MNSRRPICLNNTKLAVNLLLFKNYRIYMFQTHQLRQTMQTNKTFNFNKRQKSEINCEIQINAIK